jgi:hypothetical protein
MSSPKTRQRDPLRLRRRLRRRRHQCRDEGRQIHIIRLERIRTCVRNEADDDASNDLVAGADDRIFRVDRAELHECGGVCASPNSNRTAISICLHLRP